MDPGFVIVLGLALLFFSGVGYMAWKEHKKHGLHAESPILIQNGSRQTEEPQKGKY